MLVTMDNNQTIASSVNYDDIDKNVSLGIKMYNYLDDGRTVLWFDGKTWLFPKPVRVVQQSVNNTSELLEKISNQIDELIRSNNER